MKKGMLDIQREAREHLEGLDYANPEHLDKIYFYKSVIETTEGVMIYARRLSEHAAELAARENDPRRRAELLKIAEVNARVPAHKPVSYTHLDVYKRQSQGHDVFFIKKNSMLAINHGPARRFITQYTA